MPIKLGHCDDSVFALLHIIIIQLTAFARL